MAHDPSSDDVPAPDDSEEGHPADEEIRNPERKERSEEAARYRVRAKEAEAKVEALTDEVRTLTLRLAFNDASHAANIEDRAAAWKLAVDDLVTVETDDDGQPDAERIKAIVAHVADRYPYLLATPATADPLTEKFPALGNTGKPTGRKQTKSGLDVGALEKKFPALRNR